MKPEPQRAARGPQLSVQRSVRTRALPPARQLARWAGAALGRRSAGAQISVLLVGPLRSRTLNRCYRRRDRATNVLSFPTPPAVRATSGLLGDLVICPALLRAEARAQGKSLSAHWAHLVVHGVLHLMGFDHAKPLEAQRMERREIRVLRGLGFGNPYRAVPQAAPGAIYRAAGRG